MSKEDKIEEAKRIAEKAYRELAKEKYGSYNKSYKRKWVEVEDGKIEGYYLDGTPPKAYVLVYPVNRLIIAATPYENLRQLHY